MSTTARVFWLIMLVQGVALSPYMVTLTSLPQLGYGGIMLGTTMLVGIPMKLIVGALVDNGMRLKAALIATLLMTVMITLAYIPSIHIGGRLLLCVRVAHGIAFAMLLTVGSALVRLSLREDQLRWGFGLQSTVITLSYGVFGGGVGLLLTDYPNMVLVAVALLVAITAGIAHALPLPESSQKSATGFSWKQIWKKMIVWEAVTPGLMIIGVTITYGSVTAYIVGYAEQHSFPAWGFIWTMTVMSVIARLGCDHITKFMVRILRRNDQIDLVLSAEGIVSLIGGVILLWWWPVTISFLIAALLIGSGFSISVICLRVYTLGLVEDSKKERASSAYFCLYDLGNVAGFMIGGLVWSLLLVALILSLSVLGWKWRFH